MAAISFGGDELTAVISAHWSADAVMTKSGTGPSRINIPHIYTFKHFPHFS